MKKIEYGTIGNRCCDIALIDFLNTLREEPEEAIKTQTKALSFIHKLDTVVKYLGIQQDTKTHGFVYFNEEMVKLCRKNNDFNRLHFMDALQKITVRSYLKTRLYACIVERFKELEETVQRIEAKI